MRKIISVFVLLSMAFMITSCGNGADDENSKSETSEAVASNLHSVGEFDVSVPGNWLVVPFIINGDEENLSTDSVVLYKEAPDDITMLNHPSISIFLYDADEDALNDKVIYDDAKDIEAVTIGDITYEGFHSDNNGYPIYSVAGVSGDYQFKLILSYKKLKGEISFEDADVISIIESLTVTI